MNITRLSQKMVQLVTEHRGRALLDLNFAVSSLRNAQEQEIIDRFIKAYYEEPKIALRWLFLQEMCGRGSESAGCSRRFCLNLQRAALSLPRL